MELDIASLTAILAWGAVVGAVFSTIGAAGGILASFGLITLFGITEPNSVKPMTQIILLVSALVFIPSYLRRAAICWRLGLLLGAGGLVGAYMGSTLSAIYLSDMKTFLPLFGILTLAIAAQIIWKLISQRNQPAPKSQPNDTKGVNVKFIDIKWLEFAYADQNYRIPLWSPLLAGTVISMTAAIFGVGGGFLLVPYMASVLKMPMHIIPGTAAIAIFISLSVSIGNYLSLGAPLHVDILIPLMIGALAGALAGPYINKRVKNSWLQMGLALIVTVIGLKYTLL